VLFRISLDHKTIRLLHPEGIAVNYLASVLWLYAGAIFTDGSESNQNI
jgi:hypothetical protein